MDSLLVSHFSPETCSTILTGVTQFPAVTRPLLCYSLIVVFFLHQEDKATSMAASRLITLAATQFSCSLDSNENVRKAESLVRRAASAGANVILLQELFATRYFCQEQREQNYNLAESEESSLLLQRFQKLAAELAVVGAVRHDFCLMYPKAVPQGRRHFFLQ